MPKIVVAPKWVIEKTESENWSGTIRSDRVYQFDLNIDGGQYTLVASIGRVANRDGKQCLYPSVIYEGENFRLPDPKYTDVFYAEEIADVAEMWVGRRTAEQRHRAKSDDPFEFQLTDSKSGKSFTLRVDSTNFVGVSSPTKRGSYTYYGHITGVSDDGQYIYMDALFGGRGYYTVKSVKLDTSGIKGIFSYNIILMDYETGAADAAARKAAYDARHPKPQAEEPVEEESDETEAAVPDADTINEDSADVESEVSVEDDSTEDEEPVEEATAEVPQLGAQNVTGYSAAFTTTDPDTVL